MALVRGIWVQCQGTIHSEDTDPPPEDARFAIARREAFFGWRVWLHLSSQCAAFQCCSGWLAFGLVLVRGTANSDGSGMELVVHVMLV